MRWFLSLLIATLAASGCSQAGDGDDAPPADRQAFAVTGPAQGAPPPAMKQAPSRGLPPGAIHVEPAVIVDHSGFEQPMGASTLFLPTGWRAEGGVEWGQQHMCTNGFAFNWRAVSPDGSMSVAVLPQHGWSSSNYTSQPTGVGCENEPHTTVRQYLESVVQRFRPGARVLDFRPREDLLRETGAVNKTTPTPMGETREWGEAGEILFAYSENGRDMRGTLAAFVQFTLMRADAGMGVMENLNAFAFPAWAATAPEGRLNFAYFEALRKSLKPNPQWQQRIASHNNEIARTAIRESRKRAQITAQTYEEISRIRQESWNAYTESSDRRAREFSEAIRGVETYNDPDAPAGTVELSHYYDQAWRLNDGSYVLTNDVNFDPWGALGIEGRRLEPTP